MSGAYWARTETKKNSVQNTVVRIVRSVKAKILNNRGIAIPMAQYAMRNTGMDRMDAWTDDGRARTVRNAPKILTPTKNTQK